MGRWAGIDYGTRRIGLALADPGGRFVSPAAVLPGAGSPAADARRVADWARENEVDAIVVGLPLNMDDSEGPQAKLSRDFAAALSQAGVARVELFDERLTSFEADQLLSETGARGARRRKLRDAVAATVILTAYLKSAAGGS